MFSRLKISILFFLLLASSALAQEQTSESESDSETVETIDYSGNFTLEEGQELPRSDASKRYYAEIEKVLSGDDFAKKETVERWRLKDLDEDEKEERREKYPEWIIDIVEAFESGESSIVKISKGVEFLLWALLIGLIVFFILRYREQIGGFISNLGADTPEPDLPSSMFGLDIKKDSIPTDVVQAARATWSNGQPRDAIAILLRASLIKLVHEHDCRFFDSDTESECCDRIDQQAPSEISVFMRKLVAAWQSVAYAHIAPNDAVFEQLCQQWAEVY